MERAVKSANENNGEKPHAQVYRRGFNKVLYGNA